MFEKYSNSRDLLYSFSIVAVLTIISFFLPNFNILGFNTQNVSSSLLEFFGVLFVFILTIITIMFMFDYTKSPILMKLDKDKLLDQIFRRFFDTLIIIAISVIYFLIVMIYFNPANNIVTFYIFNGSITINFSLILNFIALILLLASITRIYRSIKLLNLIYKSLTYKKD